MRGLVAFMAGERKGSGMLLDDSVGVDDGVNRPCSVFTTGSCLGLFTGVC